MPHLVLLGDSIFDNATYVPNGPPVISQLRQVLGPTWVGTLLAVDGQTTRGVSEQLLRLPKDATHLVVSAGGNDALQESHILTQNVLSVARGLDLMHAMRERFRERYRAMVAQLCATGLPAAVCSVYDAIPGLPEAELAALGMINEVILFEAFRARLPVLDLRLVCTEAADYSETSAIEPSTRGGLKIARVIADYLAAPPSQRSVIYA